MTLKTRQRRKALWLFRVVLAGLVAGACYLLSVKDKPIDLSVNCVPGQTQWFEFTYHSAGTASQAMLDPTGQGPKRAIEIDLNGTWQETCVQSSEQGFVLQVSFQDVDGHINANITEMIDPTSPHSVLRGESFVEIAHTGKVQTIHYAEQQPKIGEHLLRELLSLRSFELKTPAEPGDTWRTEENDIHGRYRSEYRLSVIDDAMAEIVKTRLEYVPDATARHAYTQNGLAAVIPANITSRMSIHIDRQILGALTATSHVEHQLNGSIMASAQASLQLTPKQPSSPDSTTSLRTALREYTKRKNAKTPSALQRRGDLRASEVDARLDRKIQEQELGNDDWKSLSGRLARTTEYDSRLFLKTKALFKLSPETAEEAVAVLVEAADENSLRFQMLTGALSAAGTSQAQAALHTAISQLSDNTDKLRVLVGALALVEEPTEQTDAFLLELAHSRPENDEIHHSANLAIGAAALSLNEKFPTRSQKLVDHLLEELTDAKSEDERIALLAALGNSGAEKAFGPLRDALSDKKPLVRQVAASSLQLSKEAQASKLLLEAATVDPDSSVRTAAVSSLGHHDISSSGIAQIMQLAREDSSEEVRQSALSLLGNRARSFPEILDTLAWSRESDRSKDVRRLAALILARLEITS